MARELTQEHIIKICLPPELYLAVIKFQAEKEIGKSYAGLLLLTKAVNQAGAIVCKFQSMFDGTTNYNQPKS
jgi:hypothetical protein